jgi:hypothetical protein
VRRLPISRLAESPERDNETDNFCLWIMNAKTTFSPPPLYGIFRLTYLPSSIGSRMIRAPKA